MATRLHIEKLITMFTEDLPLFFNTTDFAVAATYNGSDIVHGILGKTYIAINDVESAAPSFTCSAVDVPHAKHGDTLVINSIIYNVVGVKPDGTGIMTLILEEQ